MRHFLILSFLLLLAACEPASMHKITQEPEVAFGTVLPYGQVARMCDVKDRKKLGRRMDQAPSSGRGYALYDSNPQSRAPHTFYVTGFKDNCPRQFTAAVAVFGSPDLYEQLHYGVAGQQMHKSAVDKAYEAVKSTVCKVRANKPCGKKMKTLTRNTVFISTYETFTGNARWADMLLHNGEVIAKSVKGP